MELKLILILLRRWYWLLLLGAVIGIGVGTYLTLTQTDTYTSTARVMVWQYSSSSNSNSNNVRIGTFVDAQLAEIYADLIVTEPVLSQVSQELGYDVSSFTINVSQNEQFITLSVRDTNESRPTEILTTLIKAFDEFNNSFQSGQFASSEETLSTQIDQLASQIEQTENELGTLTKFSVENQTITTQNNLDRINQNIADLRIELADLRNPTNNRENEIAIIEKHVQLDTLETQLDAYKIAYQTALVDGNGDAQNNALNEIDRLNSGIIGLQIDLLALTQPDTTEQDSLITTKQDQLDQLLITRQNYIDTLSTNNVGEGAGISQSQQLRINQLQTNLGLYRQLHNNLQASLENVRLARIQGTPNVIELDSPSEAKAVSTPSYIVIGSIFGLMLGGGIAFAWEYLDDTIKSSEDVKAVYKTPVIGYIAENKQLTTEEKIYLVDNPRSPTAESFRNIRTNLEFAEVDQGLNTILITSANPSEGKTTLSTNLGIVMAQSGKKVLVIDTDMRRPRLHRALGLHNYVGMSDLFRANATLEEVIQQTEIENFFAITSGSLPPNPAELLASERMSALLTEMQTQVDIIIIDSPPFILSDAFILAAKVDGVVLAVQPGRTQRAAADNIREGLERAGANIVGIVLSRITNQSASYYTHSTYGYYQSNYYELDNGSSNNGWLEKLASLVNGPQNNHKNGSQNGRVKSAINNRQQDPPLLKATPPITKPDNP